jgi:hypothetical protein
MVSVFTLVVLGLSTHVNHFMAFFVSISTSPKMKTNSLHTSVPDVADRFPFIMSILTLFIFIPLCVVAVFQPSKHTAYA